MTTLDEHIRQAEQDVARCDRELRERLDEVTEHARTAARSGGRIALAGVGAAAVSWLGWRLARRVHNGPAAQERQRQVEREETRRAAYRHGHGLPDVDQAEQAGKARWWQPWLKVGLVLVPFIAPARSPAVAMASAVQRGGSWPLRIIRLTRTAMDWRTQRRTETPRPAR